MTLTIVMTLKFPIMTITSRGRRFTCKTVSIDYVIILLPADIHNNIIKGSGSEDEAPSLVGVAVTIILAWAADHFH